MICKLCRSVEVHIRLEYRDDKNVLDICLCEDCAADLGIARPGSSRAPGTAEMLSVLLDPVYNSDDGDSVVCPECGTGLESYRKTGFFGCPQCYDVFSNLLEKNLRTETHRGRVPPRLKTYQRVFMDRDRLEQELALAVSTERFEEAARIRDSIHRILERESIE